MEGSAPRQLPAKLWRMAGGIWTAARGLRPRRTIEALAGGYRDNDLLTYASAISFRVAFALIPLGLFALGLLGFLHLDEVWRRDIAPGLRPNVSRAAFSVIEGTVKEVLGQRQLFWVTLGVAIAIWQISGAMRAIMRVFNAIYDVEERRSFGRRLLVSFTLATVVGVLILVAVVVARFGGAAVHAALGGGATASKAPASPPATSSAPAESRRPPTEDSARGGRPPRGARACWAPGLGRYRATNLKGRFAAHAHHPHHRGRAAPPVWRRLRLQPTRARQIVEPRVPAGRPS